LVIATSFSKRGPRKIIALVSTVVLTRADA
jgi:hypothetical protein